MNKLISCHYNMDTNRVEARFEDGTTLAIDCIAVEDEYGNTPAQRAELDWLLYNKPLEYAQMVLRGEIEHYLSLFIYIPPSYLLSFLPKFRGTYQFCLLFSAFHYTGLDKFGADVLIQ